MGEPCYLDSDDMPAIAAAVRAHQTGRRNDKPQPRVRKAPPGRPPIVAMLMEDLDWTDSVPAHVLTLRDDASTQLLTLRGRVDGGDFTLSLDGETWSAPIPFDATAEQLREALVPIAGDGVFVQLGKTTSAGTTYFVGRWIISVPAGTPLLKIDYQGHHEGDGIDGFAVWMEVRASRTLEYAGHEEQITAVVPMGEPTPLVAGVIVKADWHPGIGYVVQSAECMDFPILAY